MLGSVVQGKGGEKLVCGQMQRERGSGNVCVCCVWCCVCVCVACIGCARGCEGQVEGERTHGTV